MVKAKRRYTLFTARQLLWLVLPIVIEQIFSTSLGFFDSLMVSNIRAAQAVRSNASNAIGNVDYINNLIIQLFSAFATGGAIVTSQALGAGDRPRANKVAKQLLALVVCISLAVGGACLILSKPILALFYGNVDSSTFAYQRTYFYVTAASFPFIGLFNACAALLRAQRKSFSSMASAAISCVLNVGLNALFLFVFNMGVLGAGLATLFCRAIPALFMLGLLARKDTPVRVRIWERFRFDGAMIKSILALAVPSGVESALFQLGKLMTNTFVNAAVYATGAKSLTGLDEAGRVIHINIQANGNTIANQINNFASVVGGGVGTSCLTVIGQAVGAGYPDQVKYYMKRMLVISYADLRLRGRGEGHRPAVPFILPDAAIYHLPPLLHRPGDIEGHQRREVRDVQRGRVHVPHAGDAGLPAHHGPHPRHAPAGRHGLLDRHGLRLGAALRPLLRAAPLGPVEKGVGAHTGEWDILISIGHW